MRKQINNLLRLLPVASVVLSAAVFCGAQTSGTKHNVRPEIVPSSSAPVVTKKESDDKTTRFFYEFKQPEFYIRHIMIEHDASGRGQVKFERKFEEVPFEEPLDMSPEVIARISSLWQALRFLDSTENYQSDRQYPHLGTMFLRMESDKGKRTAEFNWTNNKDASALVNEYRRIADQAIFIFDITVARETQPLNAPKVMEGLEILLRRNGISDPKQLLPLLTDLSTDEHIPLIARNHAARLIKKIEGK